MADFDFRLDRAGVRELLKSADVRDTVHAMALDIASGVDVPDGVEVVVDDYTTDRAASSVTIKDARGRLWQVRDGVLTRAAAAAGAEVTTK